MTDWAFILCKLYFFLFYGHYINCVIFFYTVDWYLAARIKFCVCKEDHRHRVVTKVYFLWCKKLFSMMQKVNSPSWARQNFFYEQILSFNWIGQWDVIRNAYNSNLSTSNRFTVQYAIVWGYMKFTKQSCIIYYVVTRKTIQNIRNETTS